MAWVNIGAYQRRDGKASTESRIRLVPVSTGGHELTVTLSAPLMSTAGLGTGDSVTVYFDDGDGRIAVVKQPKSGEGTRRVLKHGACATGRVTARALPPWLVARVPIRQSLTCEPAADAKTFGRPAIILTLPAAAPRTAPSPARRPAAKPCKPALAEYQAKAISWLRRHGQTVSEVDGTVYLNGDEWSAAALAKTCRILAERLDDTPDWLDAFEVAVR